MAENHKKQENIPPPRISKQFFFFLLCILPFAEPGTSESCSTIYNLHSNLCAVCTEQPHGTKGRHGDGGMYVVRVSVLFITVPLA